MEEIIDLACHALCHVPSANGTTVQRFVISVLAVGEGSERAPVVGVLSSPRQEFGPTQRLKKGFLRSTARSSGRAAVFHTKRVRQG
jgi:hypothetical protein